MAGTQEIFIADVSDRAAGVQTVCEQYDLSGFFGADVALKANYNSADPPPACTHIDSLDALSTVILAEKPKNSHWLNAAAWEPPGTCWKSGE